MKEPWSVDVRYADGQIIQAEFRYGEGARDFAARMDRTRKDQERSGERGSHRITGIMVWKSRFSDKLAVTYGEAFTY